MQDKAVLPIQSSRYNKLIVCPCCGCKFEGDLRVGCAHCGAQAVGEPLARPEHILPSYGRALFVCTVGALMLLAFLISISGVLLERPPLSLDSWSIVAAAEIAAWRLKWLALPLVPFAVWSCLRLCATLRREPARFNGSRFAHGGLAACALVALAFATCIGVTIPRRLDQRQRAFEAGQEVRLDTFKRAMLEYRQRYSTLPSDLGDLKYRLRDPDGSIAAMLADVDPSGYKTWTLQASLPAKKSASLRGAAIRPVSASTDDLPGERVQFTDYELRLPGEDKILNTDDDWVMRNGVVSKPLPQTSQANQASPSSDTGTP